MSSASKPIVLSVSEWDASAIKYMPPKTNEKGGKSINIISKQSNRGLHISTPLMMTWGVSDFVDEKGESDGKYSMSLNFPNEEYRNANTDAFLAKLKAFENQILDDAVRNSELWWGEEMSRELCKHTFFPFMKYSKNKDTKKIDLSKPPSIRAKVPFYNGRWAVELYDTKSNLIFPCDNENLTPIDFVPKLSNVACVIQCGGIWIGGKGWGLTWKLVQCVVKPREVVSVYGRCHIQLSPDECYAMEKQELPEVDDETNEMPTQAPGLKRAYTTYTPITTSTTVEDSDDEGAAEQPAAAAEPEADEPEVAAVVAQAIVKKIVKKAPAASAPAPAAQADEPEAAKKKIMKKKVVA